MAFLKNVVGLDPGSHGVKAVEFRQTLRSFEAVRLHSVARADEEIALPELLAQFVELHGFPTDNVVSALPGDRVSTRRMSFPFGDRKRLTQAVPFEVESEVPFDLEDLLIDWEVVGGDRSRADVVASIAPRAEVSSFLEPLREAGCEPRILEAEGLVLGNLAAVFDLPQTCALVDLGHRKTTLCLLIGGTALAARTIPLGGKTLTQALIRDHGLSPGDAERAKCEDGLFSRASGEAPPETGAALDRIAREILRTLGSWEPLLAETGATKVESLVLFGGTAQAERLDDHLSERVGVPATRLGLPSAEHGAGLVAGGNPILFAPAIALALRGTAQARTRMNFRQDEFAVRMNLGRYVRDFRWTGVMAALTLALAAASFGVSTLLQSRQASALESQSDQLYQEAFPGSSVPASVLASLRQEVSSANERAEFLGVYRGNLSALDLLTKISNLVPQDLDIVFEELSIDRQIVRMRVYAKSFEAADRLGVELAKFPPFAEARIGAIETDRKRGGKRFNVTISLAATGERE